MPAGGLYAGNADTVQGDGSLTGWADANGQGYGGVVGGGTAYRFGPIMNHWGTWGQLVYETPASLVASNNFPPTGLAGHMPPGPAPSGHIFVQGHLVNGSCGGCAARRANLIPFCTGINALHRGLESSLQLLMCRGRADGVAPRTFNPNGIANTRLIYRTHRWDPIAITHPHLIGAIGTHQHLPGHLPGGIAVSLGFVINGTMATAADVTNELNGAWNNPLHAAAGNPIHAVRWFHQRMYAGGSGVPHRNRIINMIGGVLLSY